MKNKLVFIMGLGREHCLNINKALYYCTLWSSFPIEVRDTLCEVVEAVLQWWGVLVVVMLPCYIMSSDQGRHSNTTVLSDWL